jgi:hypothetical protein
MRMSSGSAKTASRFRATSTTRWPSARSSDSQSSSPTAQSAVSSPKLFEQYRLEGRKGCDRIEPRLVAADPLAQFRVSAANVEASSWSGITPAERRIAFRSQRMSNSNSSTPITSCSRCSGTRSTNGPSAATMSASAARPAVEPSPPDASRERWRRPARSSGLHGLDQRRQERRRHDWPHQCQTACHASSPSPTGEANTPGFGPRPAICKGRH